LRKAAAEAKPKPTPNLAVAAITRDGHNGTNLEDVVIALQKEGDQLQEKVTQKRRIKAEHDLKIAKWDKELAKQRGLDKEDEDRAKKEAETTHGREL
jgi:hypothetical protein